MSTPKLKYYVCAVCGADDPKHLYPIKGFNIVQCKECSFVYVNPRIPNEDLYKLYSSDYFNSTTENYGYRNYELTSHLRVKTFQKWINITQPFLPKQKGAILDIGCASGYFLEEMRTKGWDIEGIELDKKMVEKLRSKNIPVSDQPFETFITNKKYKLITLFDVIEHIPDLKTAFKKLHELLDEDGVVILITPDFNSTQRKLFGKRWFQYKPQEHIQYFSPATLQKAIEQHELKMVFHTPGGQYADVGFILDRLDRYNFKTLKKIAEFIFKIFGLKNKYWYLDTGSILAVLNKK